MGGDANGAEFPASEVYALGNVAVGDEKEARKGGVLRIPVGIASVALGPGALGLAAYTVHQVREHGEKDRSRTSELIERNSAEITRLLTEALHDFRDNAKEGLTHDEGEVKEVEELLTTLVEQHALCLYVLSCGSKVESKDAEALSTLASNAVTKLVVVLRKIPQGSPRRLPLVLLHTFAIRARVDSRDIASPPPPNASPVSPDPFNTKLLKNARDTIVTEARDLLSTSPQTPYTVGVTCAPALAHYALLHRALSLLVLQAAGDPTLWETRPLAVSSPDTTQSHPAQAGDKLLWEDGMEALRAFVALPTHQGTSSEEETIEIATVADILWFIEWKRLSPDAPLAGIPRKVPVGLALAYMGFPAGGEGKRSPDAAKRVLAPAFLSDAEKRLGNSLREIVGTQEVKLCLAEISEEQRGVFESVEDALTKPASGAQNGGDATRGKPESVPREIPSARKPEGAVVWTGSWRPEVKVEGHAGEVKSLAVGPEGVLYSGGVDCIVKKWKGSECLATLTGHTYAVRGIGVAWDGSVFSGGYGDGIRQWRDGQCVAGYQHERERYTTGVVVSPTDGTVYACEYYCSVWMKRVGQGGLTLPAQGGNLWALGVTDDGTLLSGGGLVVQRWKDGSCIETLQGEFGINEDGSFAVGPDGTFFVGGSGGTVKQYKGTKCLTSFRGDSNLVRALACGPDGSLFVGGDDKSVKQWRNGECVGTMLGHESYVSALVVDPSGILYSGGGDGTIIAWKI